MFVIHLYLVLSVCLFKMLFFSGFQHFSLAVAPQDNGPQRPLDCLNTQNTLALQQTGVYTENLPLNMKYNLIFL